MSRKWGQGEATNIDDFWWKWLGKPATKHTWITENELKKVDLDIYAEAVKIFLLESNSFFQPREIDAGAS